MLVVYLTSPLVVGSLFFCFIPDSRPSLFPKREDCVRFSSEWCFPRHSSHQQQQIGSMMAAPITRWMLLCLALLSLTPASFSSLMTFHQGGYNQLQIALAAQTPVPANCSQMLHQLEVSLVEKRKFPYTYISFSVYTCRKGSKFVWKISLETWRERKKRDLFN